MHNQVHINLQLGPSSTLMDPRRSLFFTALPLPCKQFYYEYKTKSRKWGRPGNEVGSLVSSVARQHMHYHVTR